VQPFQHHLDRTELGREVPNLGGAVAGDPAPRSATIRGSRRPHPLGGLPWPCVWALTRPGWSSRQAAASRRPRPERRSRAGRSRGSYRPRSGYRQARRSGGDVEHAAAAQDRIGHGMVSSKPATVINRSAPGASVPSVVLQRNEAVLESSSTGRRCSARPRADRELAAATAEAAEDRKARVVLLRGAGIFCAGRTSRCLAS
jgi:hypothetical protein